MMSQVKIQENQDWYRQILIRFPLQVIVLKICFLWPYQSKFTQIIGRLFINFIFCTSIIGVLSKMYEDIQKRGADSRMLESLCQAIIGFVTIYCYDYVTLKYEKVKNCWAVMGRIFQDNDPSGQKVILQSVTKFMNFNSILTVTFILMSTIGGAGSVVIPDLLTWALPGNKTFKKSLPYNWDFFMDEDEYFYQIFAIQSIFLNLFSCIVASLSQYEFSCIGFIIGELFQLQNYLKETDFEYMRMLDENRENAHQYLIKKLNRVIRHHNECTKLFEQLYNLTSTLMFVLILCTSCNIILSGTTMVILMDTSSATAMKMLIIHCLSLISITCACVPSQFLSNACNDMFTKFYCIKWYEYPPKARLMVVLLLLRSMKPLVLVAGSIIELNFETCSNVIKRALSFTATFRSFYNSDFA